VDSAFDRWGDAERAWIAIEWTLARDPQVGTPLNESGSLRGFVYAGAKSIGQPDVDVIYEIDVDTIIVRSAVFTDAKASQAAEPKTQIEKFRSAARSYAEQDEATFDAALKGVAKAPPPPKGSKSQSKKPGQ